MAVSRHSMMPSTDVAMATFTPTRKQVISFILTARATSSRADTAGTCVVIKVGMMWVGQSYQAVLLPITRFPFMAAMPPHFLNRPTCISLQCDHGYICPQRLPVGSAEPNTTIAKWASCHDGMNQVRTCEHVYVWVSAKPRRRISMIPLSGQLVSQWGGPMTLILQRIFQYKMNHTFKAAKARSHKCKVCMFAEHSKKP